MSKGYVPYTEIPFTERLAEAQWWQAQAEKIRHERIREAHAKTFEKSAPKEKT